MKMTENGGYKYQGTNMSNHKQRMRYIHAWKVRNRKSKQTDIVNVSEDDIQKSSIQIYKETSEDWYPSFELCTTHINKLLVRVSFHYPITVNRGYMVSVWGADDCGMELQFTDKQKAMDCFMDIISLKVITKNQLEELGLHSA